MLNYLGPNDGRGIRIYMDGVLIESDVTKGYGSYNVSGVGRVVVGRSHTEIDSNYAGVDIDELLFFNQKLSSDDIINMKDTI